MVDTAVRTDLAGPHPPVTITAAAAEEIKRLRNLEKEAPPYLRLGVSAGGCSGMSYTMAFETERHDTDRAFDCHGLTVLVDAQALHYLAGITLDFKGGLMGGGFNFSNPRAKRSCGCGSSFSV